MKQEALFKRRVLSELRCISCRESNHLHRDFQERVPIWINEHRELPCEKHGEEYLNEKDEE